MRVFISHSGKDKAEAEQLAIGLKARGIECWLDGCEIGLGDDIVASINAGLDQADAGVIVFGQHTRDSRWIEAEASYLIWARIEEGKRLIPVVLGEKPWIPPLLRPLARRAIGEVDAIADALLQRGRKVASSTALAPGRTERVLISLGREGASGIRVRVRIQDHIYEDQTFKSLPRSVVAGETWFLRGLTSGVHRSAKAAMVVERAAMESKLADLGRGLGQLCLPGEAGPALAELVSGCPIGTTIEVRFEADDPSLLGLPFETMRLPDDRILTLQPSVVVFRRRIGLAAPAGDPLPGPLKVLVVLGAPAEGSTRNAVLDHERESQNILDAVATGRQLENFQVRFLEVGHPGQVGNAFETDAYHVLHISCHGGPGELELEDEDGKAVRVTATMAGGPKADPSDDREHGSLIEPIQDSGASLPLVLLNACHGGTAGPETAGAGRTSFAEDLLRAGVPAVLAMQTSVSDAYAVAFSRAFYEHLARRENLLPSHALAAARKELEAARRSAIEHGDPLAVTQPEYATATLFVAGEDHPLADFGQDMKPLKRGPVYVVDGPVPQLRMDDLIGRRRELREVVRTLRDSKRTFAGVVLTGLGGIGKSAVAGRATQRLSEDGWTIAAQAGRFDLTGLAVAMGTKLRQRSDERAQQLGQLLIQENLQDDVRLALVQQALQTLPVLLVLDDFEQNLMPGGSDFLDSEVCTYLGKLIAGTGTGRLLITSRHPLPGFEEVLCRVPIGPLSTAETRKLMLRLDGLKSIDLADFRRVMSVIGGHPRMIEFLDALLRGSEGRLTHVTQKLAKLRAEAGVEQGATVDDLEESLRAALLLGMQDVLLEELLAIARRNSDEEALLQLAVSNLPVAPEGLARMLADGPDGAGDPGRARQSLRRLADLSLVYEFPDGSSWVHRWTAAGLVKLSDPAGHRLRCARAGRYRWWRVANESHSLEDGIEAVRNFLEAHEFDAAVASASSSFEALQRFRQSSSIALFASEILETLPTDHAGYAAIADAEARACLSLGLTDKALARYRLVLDRFEHLAAAEPERADYQRDLSVSYNKLGDIYRDLGEGEKARDFYAKDLAIAEHLAAAEPERADYQRDLSVSYNKLGDIYRDLGEGEKARDFYAKALAIRERLAAAEPERADYQRDLSVSRNRLAALSDVVCPDGVESAPSHGDL